MICSLWTLRTLNRVAFMPVAPYVAPRRLHTYSIVQPFVMMVERTRKVDSISCETRRGRRAVPQPAHQAVIQAHTVFTVERDHVSLFFRGAASSEVRLRWHKRDTSI